MGFRKITILSVVLVITLLAIPGCNGAETDSPPTSEPPDATYPSEWIDLSLSPVPKLGETAELTFHAVVGPNWEGSSDSKAGVEFSYANPTGSYSQAKYGVPVPLDEVMVSGELYWEGDIFEDGLPKLTATIQLPREGVWVIRGYFSGESWTKNLEREIKVFVTEDTAMLMNNQEFRSGPFGYLSYFRYGQLSDRMTPSENDPTILELDISKTPCVDEEVQLTCRISSIIDFPGYTARISFWKRVEGTNKTYEVPQDSILVDGDLRWAGDLKKDDSMEFSATIKFPEEGDWEIKAYGDHPKYPGNLYANTIQISVGTDKPYFGWEERPRQKLSWYERVWQELSCSPRIDPTISPYD